MGKEGIVVLCMLLATLIFGCVTNPLDIAKTDLSVNNFLEEYPNAEVLAIHLTAEQARDRLEDIKNICGEQIIPKDYYRVSITDITSGLKLIAYIDTEKKLVECVRKFAGEEAQAEEEKEKNLLASQQKSTNPPKLKVKPSDLEYSYGYKQAEIYKQIVDFINSVESPKDCLQLDEGNIYSSGFVEECFMQQAIKRKDCNVCKSSPYFEEGGKCSTKCNEDTMRLNSQKANEIISQGKPLEECLKFDENTKSFCITSLAQKPEDCLYLSGNPRNFCITSIASSQNKISLCDSIEGDAKRSCYIQVSSDNKLLKACESFRDVTLVRSCYTDYYNDPSVGNELSICDDAGERKVACYTYLARYEGFDLKNCDVLGAEYSDCYVAVANRTGEKGLCDKVITSKKGRCLANIAINGDDVFICIGLPGDSGCEGWSCQTYCVVGLFQKLNAYDEKNTIATIQDCDAAKTIRFDNRNVDSCYYNVAIRDLNLDACQGIEAAQKREDCVTIVQHLKG